MAAAPQQSQNDNSLAPLWISIAVFSVGLILWYFFHTQIVAFIFTIKIWQAELLSLFMPSMDASIAFIKQVNPANVGYRDLGIVMESIGKYIAYPVAFILLGLSVMIYFRHSVSRYKRVFSMNTLVGAEKDNWPQILPVAKIDLVETDIDKGGWAMAMPPLKFAAHYHLIKDETVHEQEEYGPKLPRTAGLKKGEARKVFALQLGPYWEGPDRLPMYCRALFAVLCARANYEEKIAADLLRQISLSVPSGQLNFAGVDDIIKKYINTKPVQYVIKRHAYVVTVMASMLSLARQGGVLASADFLWLKPIDRRLWYILNNVGRQTAFPEVAGAFAHWLSELELKRKLYVPMVDNAVQGLEEALSEILYEPESADSGIKISAL